MGSKNETQKNQRKGKEKKGNIKENKEKKKFAEFVSMTLSEKDKLVNAYGENFTKRCITVLDNYKGSSGKKYESDYKAILTWVVGKVKAESKQDNAKSNKYSSYEQRKYDDNTLKNIYANQTQGGDSS